MIGKYDIRNCDTGDRFEYAICTDADDDMAVVIHVQRPDLMVHICVVKVRELHPDYLNGARFEEMCMKAASCWESIPELLRMSYKDGIAKLSGEDDGFFPPKSSK